MGRSIGDTWKANAHDLDFGVSFIIPFGLSAQNPPETFEMGPAHLGSANIASWSSIKWARLEVLTKLLCVTDSITADRDRLSSPFRLLVDEGSKLVQMCIGAQM